VLSNFIEPGSYSVEADVSKTNFWEVSCLNISKPVVLQLVKHRSLGLQDDVDFVKLVFQLGCDQKEWLNTALSEDQEFSIPQIPSWRKFPLVLDLDWLGFVQVDYVFGTIQKRRVRQDGASGSNQRWVDLYRCASHLSER
jgi:hypothetical protein